MAGDLMNLVRVPICLGRTINSIPDPDYTFIDRFRPVSSRSRRGLSERTTL